LPRKPDSDKQLTELRPDRDGRKLPKTWVRFSFSLKIASGLYTLATPNGLTRENDEPSRNHRNSVSVIFKGICFAALGAQPEVLHRVRVLGLFAFRVGLVKTEDSTSSVLERSRTGGVYTIRNHQDFPCGVLSNKTAPQSITKRVPVNQTH